MGLSTGREKYLFEIIEWMHSATSLQALHRTILDGIVHLIPGDCCDMVLCGGNAEGGGNFYATPDTYSGEEIAYMLAHAEDHPVVQALNGGAVGALCTSQCTSDREWRSSGLFSEGGYRRLGLRYELVLDVPGVSDQSLAAISIVRRCPDFSARDRDVLNLMRPHIARAWLQAERKGLEYSPALLRHLFPVLTQREAEVLYWVIEGKQNVEIASILGRRLGTVQEHVENTIRKLGMENRHQMTVAVLRACGV